MLLLLLLLLLVLLLLLLLLLLQQQQQLLLLLPPSPPQPAHPELICPLPSGLQSEALDPTLVSGTMGPGLSCDDSSLQPHASQ